MNRKSTQKTTNRQCARCNRFNIELKQKNIRTDSEAFDFSDFGLETTTDEEQEICSHCKSIEAELMME